MDRVVKRSPFRRRRPPVTAEETRAREIVAMRSDGICEVQVGANHPTGGVCQGRAREIQHRKARSHCRPDELWRPSNLLHVCGHGNSGGCHGWIHSHPRDAYSYGWSVRSTMDPADAMVLLWGVQFVLLTDDGDKIPCDFDDHIPER